MFGRINPETSSVEVKTIVRLIEDALGKVSGYDDQITELLLNGQDDEELCFDEDSSAELDRINDYTFEIESKLLPAQKVTDGKMIEILCRKVNNKVINIPLYTNKMIYVI